MGAVFRSILHKSIGDRDPGPESDGGSLSFLCLFGCFGKSRRNWRTRGLDLALSPMGRWRDDPFQKPSIPYILWTELRCRLPRSPLSPAPVPSVCLSIRRFSFLLSPPDASPDDLSSAADHALRGKAVGKIRPEKSPENPRGRASVGRYSNICRNFFSFWRLFLNFAAYCSK